MRPATGLNSSRRLRVFKAAFGVVGAVFLVVAFISTWDSTRDTVMPPWPLWVLATAIVVAGMVAAGLGWLALFAGGSRRGLLSGFYAAQLGKYVPGGIWQAVGQIGLTTSAAGSGAKAAAGFSVYTIIQLTSGLALAAVAGVFVGSLPMWVRLVTAVGWLALVLLDRRWMVRLAAFIGRRTPAVSADLVPSQRGIIASFSWATTTLAGASLGYAVLLAGLSDGDALITMTLAFALAWLVGFLAVPFPSGLGVREAVLIGSLSAGAAPIIAASLAHRLVSIGAEVLLIAVTHRRKR